MNPFLRATALAIISTGLYLSACEGQKADNRGTEENENMAGQTAVPEEAEAPKKEVGPDVSGIHEGESREERIARHVDFFVHDFCACFEGYQSKEEIWAQTGEEKTRIAQCLEVVKLNMAYTLLDMDKPGREEFRQLFLDKLQDCPCSGVIKGLD